MDDLTSAPLRSLLQLAHKPSVSDAARALGLSQPAVTKQIRALEQRLGCRLLERVGRGIRLTQEGELLASYARRSAEVLDDFRSELSELRGGKTGRLTIGAGVTTSVVLLPRWLRALRRDYPGIDVTVRTGTSRDVEAWVLAGEVDLGFVTSAPRSTALVRRAVFDEEIVLVVEPAARKTPARELSFISFPRGTGFREYLEQRCAARHWPLDVKMESDSVEAIKSFVAVGLGASFLPHTTVEAELKSGVLARIQAHPLGALRRRTLLLRRQGKRPSFAVERFAALVR